MPKGLRATVRWADYFGSHSAIDGSKPERGLSSTARLIQTLLLHLKEFILHWREILKSCFLGKLILRFAENQLVNKSVIR